MYNTTNLSDNDLKIKIYKSLKSSIITYSPNINTHTYQSSLIIFKDSYNGIMDILNDG